MILLHLNVVTFFSIYFSTGSSKVHQTPAEIFQNEREEAKVTCSHDIQNYDRILWYKQTDTRLQFLGQMFYSDAYPEDGAGVKMDGGADRGQNCTLTIGGLTLSNSAVYFCAARLHSATHHCSSVQKPPRHTVISSLTAHSLVHLYLVYL